MFESAAVKLSKVLATNMILRTFTRSLFKLSRPIASDIKCVDFLICIDLECTCDSPVQIHPMEIIEIACKKINIRDSIRRDPHDKISTKSMFHSYVKPVVNPNLTLFCQDLTGILQSTIENAPTIEKVSQDLLHWLKEENLINDTYEQKENFSFASCGNFDLKMLSPIIKDCHFNNSLELPVYFKEWINVKKTFVNHKREWPKGLYHMMELLGEEPLGRLHSARDDCLNLARVVECLHQDGCRFHITNKV